MTRPVDRRYVADAAAHRRDAARFCPRCAGGLALTTEFCGAEARRFYCSCGGCGWTGEITPTGDTAVGHEPDHWPGCRRSISPTRRARTAGRGSR